jgi:solute carrier family 44 (choline transporter-like protein), member 2/4/5
LSLHQAKDSKNRVLQAILCCIQCCLWCLEKCMKFLNKNAYIQVCADGVTVVEPGG